MPDPTPAPAAPAAPGAAPAAPAAPAAAGAAPGAPMTDRRPPLREGGPIQRRSDSSRCRTPGCQKYHDFFQWNGKYYCLECYHALHSATKLQTIPR